jgi:hypothetical protein
MTVDRQVASSERLVAEHREVLRCSSPLAQLDRRTFRLLEDRDASERHPPIVAVDPDPKGAARDRCEARDSVLVDVCDTTETLPVAFVALRRDPATDLRAPLSSSTRNSRGAPRRNDSVRSAVSPTITTSGASASRCSERPPALASGRSRDTPADGRAAVMGSHHRRDRCRHRSRRLYGAVSIARVRPVVRRRARGRASSPVPTARWASR